ncbi:hypothetical protein C9J21_22420 [Photobacterium phosphoreum]|nr:hypothetical protein C9J21_22420 [Photobacterium phosphoreum]
MINKKSLIAVSVILALHYTSVNAEALNLDFLQGGAKIDAAAWNNLSNKYVPGRYLVDVALNNNDLGKQVLSVTPKDKDALCLSDEWLRNAGININKTFYAKEFNQ